jgi:hypothetical protein
MRRIEIRLGIAALALAVASSALASPTPNGAYIKTRVYNDCPGSTLVVNNLYPALISIGETNVGCVGFANLHYWRFSEDGGASPAIYQNGDGFRFCATLVLDGSGQGEAGLQVAPWWSETDGRLNVRTTDGAIEAFGGRLPFYSFTASNGLVYVKGTPITLEIIYKPNGLSMASPATIEYIVTYGGTFSSGVLPFDQGNPTEDPPHGQWGILQPTQVGGHFQWFAGQSGPQGSLTASWRDICYEDKSVAVTPTQWGTMKALYR